MWITSSWLTFKQAKQFNFHYFSDCIFMQLNYFRIFEKKQICSWKTSISSQVSNLDVVFLNNLLWIAKFSEHTRVWTTNLLHKRQLPNAQDRVADSNYLNLLPYNRRSWSKLDTSTSAKFQILVLSCSRFSYGSKIPVTTRRVEL